LLRQGVLDEAFDRAAEGPGAVVFVEALFDQELEGVGGEVVLIRN
jgi:hypothetical protein